LLEVDIERFWQDDEVAHQQNCFSSAASQVALGIRMSDECVFAELGEAGNPWGEIERDRRIELNKRYNDKAEKIVGRRLLNESFPLPDEKFPEIRGIGEVFGGKYFFNGQAVWLEGTCKTPPELEKLLDRIEKTDLRSFILPDNWESEKRRIFEIYGIKPELWRGVRGPVTLAMSVYGVENLIFLILDEPDLAVRFSQNIARVICTYASIMDAEAGYAPGDAPGGFGFADDNCCLLTPEMYELFGYPVLEKVFATFCAKEGDARYQHSDSSMGHLLPLLGRLDLTGCNFGPDVFVDQIRKHMPKTRIDGVLAPFTLMGNDESRIIAEVRRDCALAKGSRGLNIHTAGSINNGSLLTSMRAVMHAIQNYGRF
jgi:uroporphyrinogen decarboxylase